MKTFYFILIFVFVGCDTIPKEETYAPIRKKVMENVLSNNCIQLLECASGEQKFRMTFYLRYDREKLWNASAARLPEYYGQNTTSFSALDDYKKDFDENCIRKKAKDLELRFADGAGRFGESYKVLISLYPKEKKCSANVEDSWLSDAQD